LYYYKSNVLKSEPTRHPETAGEQDSGEMNFCPHAPWLWHNFFRSRRVAK